MVTATKKPRPRVLGEDPLLTTKQVANLLNVTQEGVRLLIESGQLPYTRPTRHYRVWKSDVDALVAMNQRGG